MRVIEAEGLRKEFSDEIVAVAGIDLAVEQGEVFAFLGPNGAGKTTTVRMLTTLLRPTSGNARVAGYDVYREQHQIRRSIGVALQEAGLDGLATARELLELQAKLFGMDSPTAKRRASEMLDVVGLVDAAERQVKTFSGGMKRRLDLASALVHEPLILFLDEPTEGLDPASRAAVWQEVQRLNSQSDMTVFLTTHLMEEAERLCDRVGIIDQGQIRAEGTRRELVSLIGQRDRVDLAATGPLVAVADALRAMPGVNEATAHEGGIGLLVDEARTILPRLLESAAATGASVNGVEIVEPDLEAVFLHLTGRALRD